MSGQKQIEAVPIRGGFKLGDSDCDVLFGMVWGAKRNPTIVRDVFNEFYGYKAIVAFEEDMVPDTITSRTDTFATKDGRRFCLAW